MGFLPPKFAQEGRPFLPPSRGKDQICITVVLFQPERWQKRRGSGRRLVVPDEQRLRPPAEPRSCHLGSGFPHYDGSPGRGRRGGEWKGGEGLCEIMRGMAILTPPTNKFGDHNQSPSP